jgi:hypothetical protein
MSQEIHANSAPMDLLAQCGEDGVAQDHAARLIREFVGALNFRN